MGRPKKPKKPDLKKYWESIKVNRSVKDEAEKLSRIYDKGQPSDPETSDPFWGQKLFTTPVFFDINPKPTTIDKLTPEQLEYLKNINFWDDTERHKTADEAWDALTDAERKKHFDRLVTVWPEQLEVFHVCKCLGFNQDYYQVWDEEAAEKHENELMDSRTLWGYFLDNFVDSSRYGITIEAARENAKETHADYLKHMPNPRQSTLFTKEGTPNYKPPKKRPKKPAKLARIAPKTRGGDKRSPSIPPPHSRKPAQLVKWQDEETKRTQVVGKEQTNRPGSAWSFLGWVLEFTMFDWVTQKAYRWTWRDSEALAMLTNNAKSLFITRMVEHVEETFSAPTSVKKVKKLFETWSKKKAHLKWTATVEDIPEIIPDFEPMSIKYWSDKYSSDPMGQVYFHEFEQDTGISMGLALTKAFPKARPIAIKVIGCKITSRGIE